MSALLTPEEVARLKALEKKARGDIPLRVEASKAYPGYLLVCDGGADEDDAALFESLRNAAPSLLAAAELLPVLHSALKRLRSDVRDIFNRVPVRAYDETLCEADAALEAYRLALGEIAAK